MRSTTLLFFFLGSILGQGEEQSTSEVFEELLTTHNQLESYFAVYEGTAPGGKSINAVITCYPKANITAIQAQFLIGGRVVAEPLQVTMPKLGIAINGSEALHLHDANLILGELGKAFSSLYSNNNEPLGRWSPALSLSKENASAQLTFSPNLYVPWLRGELPENTTYVKSDKHVTFITPDNATYQVQLKTGILERQNYPNEEGDRTLILKELQLDLSEAEIEAFASQLIPPNLPKTNFREHSLFSQIQLDVIQRLVNLVDNNIVTVAQVQERLQAAKYEIEDYLAIAYPEAPSMITDRTSWENTIEQILDEDEDKQATLLIEKISENWRTNVTHEASQLTTQSAAGKKAAGILANEIRERFLAVAAKKALADYQAAKK